MECAVRTKSIVNDSQASVSQQRPMESTEHSVSFFVCSKPRWQRRRRGKLRGLKEGKKGRSAPEKLGGRSGEGVRRQRNMGATTPCFLSPFRGVRGKKDSIVFAERKRVKNWPF